MFKFFENLQEELILKIFQYLDCHNQSNIAQVDTKFNCLVNDKILMLEETKLQLLTEIYGKLPNHNHRSAMQIRSIFKKAFAIDNVVMEEAMKDATTQQLSKWMEGFYRGANIALGNSMHEHLVTNSRPSLR